MLIPSVSLFPPGDFYIQRPYRYFSIRPLKWFFPCPIAIQFSPVTGQGLKFVKKQSKIDIFMTATENPTLGT